MKMYKCLDKNMNARFGRPMKYKLRRMYHDKSGEPVDVGFNGYHASKYILDALKRYQTVDDFRLFVCDISGDIDIEYHDVAVSNIILIKEITDIESALYEEIKQNIDNEDYMISVNRLGCLYYSLMYRITDKFLDFFDEIYKKNLSILGIVPANILRKHADYFFDKIKEVYKEVYKENEDIDLDTISSIETILEGLSPETIDDNIDFIMDNFYMFINSQNDKMRKRILINSDKLGKLSMSKIMDILSKLKPGEFSENITSIIEGLGDNLKYIPDNYISICENNDEINKSLIENKDLLIRNISKDTLTSIIFGRMDIEVYKVFEYDINWNNAGKIFNFNLRDLSYELFEFVYKHLKSRKAKTKAFIDSAFTLNDKIISKHWSDKCVDWNRLYNITKYDIPTPNISLQMKNKIFKDKVLNYKTKYSYLLDQINNNKYIKLSSSVLLGADMDDDMINLYTNISKPGARYPHRILTRAMI